MNPVESVGVPVEQDLGALVPPNWSQFVPDLIVALVMGLVVGLALHYVQRQGYIRDQKQEAQRSWDRLQSRLRNWFSGSPISRNHEWIDESRFRGILTTVDGEPIQDWARFLAFDKILSALVRLEHNTHRALALSKELDELLEQVLPELRPVQFPQTMESYKKTACIARSLARGLDPNGADTNFHGDDELQKSLQHWAQRSLADPRVAVVLSEFLIAKRRTELDFRTIARSFQDADRVEA